MFETEFSYEKLRGNIFGNTIANIFAAGWREAQVAVGHRLLLWSTIEWQLLSAIKALMWVQSVIITVRYQCIVLLSAIKILLRPLSAVAY